MSETVTQGPVAREPSGAAPLALFYGVWFASTGISMPFWPVWLSSRGLDGGEIGLLLASTLVVRVAGLPLIGLLADRIGSAKPVLATLGLVAAGAGFSLLGAERFWSILAFGVVANASFSSMLPLVETATLSAARAGRLDYGRVRLVGSASFLVVALSSGWLLAGRAADWIVISMASMVLATVAVVPLLPKTARAAGTRGRLSLAGFRRILGDVALRRMFWASGLIQGSHMLFYGFATLMWRGFGFSEGVIGALWAEGVVAEILMFWVGPRLLAWLGPRGLLILGGSGALLRWTLTACVTDLRFLIVLQLLHGLTFAATHLGAMHYLARNAPEGLTTTAQTLHSALPQGVLGGLLMVLSGRLYGWVGTDALFAMAACGGLGLCAALMLPAQALVLQPRRGPISR